jgi:site-specific recombinase XerD
MDNSLKMGLGLSLAQATLGQSLQTFLELGLSGRSAETHAWYKKHLVSLVAQLGPDLPVAAVMDVDLLTWYAGLEARREKWGGASTHPSEPGRLSTNYLHGFVRSARLMFKWLHDRRIIDSDPARVLPLPHLPRVGRKGISDRDATIIIDLARAGLGDGHRERDYALLRFLESTGSRLGGIAGLELANLNLDQKEPVCRRAVVCEKGTKERTVMMTSGCYSALKAWVAVRPQISDNHVFLGQARSGAWHPITENGIYQVLERYANAAGVTQNWNPHQWRHRYGRKLAECGMSIGAIAQLMGHEDIHITQAFYGIFAVGELQCIYDKIMPDF